MIVQKQWYLLVAVVAFFMSELACTFSESQAPPPEALLVQIGMVKSRLAKGEPVKVKILFRNASNVPFALNTETRTWGEASLRFDITAPSGHMLKYSCMPPRRPVPNRSDFEILEVGGDVQWEFDLRECYEIEAVGTYKVTGAYFNTNNGAGFGLNAWIGEVRSNTLKFEIIK